MRRLLLSSILVIFAFMLTKGQERVKPTAEMYEKIRAQKISFFTEKLGLTPAEAQVFWPVYNEFEKKRFEIQRQKHDFERMPGDKYDTLSDTEIEKLTSNYIESFEKEAMLLKEYNKQFLKVLPKKKVLLLYRTENEFRGHLIREYNRGQKRD